MMFYNTKNPYLILTFILVLDRLCFLLICNFTLIMRENDSIRYHVYHAPFIEHEIVPLSFLQIRKLNTGDRQLQGQATVWFIIV